MTGPKKILILGSGGLKIGQAGEFDYSGSQAIKAFREEGIQTVLINPNIATVQTDPDMADTVYFQPLIPTVVTRIIAKEEPDAVALSFGGQTALNLGLGLDQDGIFAQAKVRILGTPVQVIRVTEDRELFKQALAEIDVKTATSTAATTVEGALAAADKIGYPIMIRAAFSLGGLGSGVMRNPQQLARHAGQALRAAPQVLIEEYLEGWKEVEYEVVRDAAGNTITVCNMENLDPMGIHTGESIVVAPSQTLTNAEYHGLREVAIKTIRHLGIIGECNIQYALNPATSEYRVIEVNARLSRSSALASKATGYPLAFVAAKLMLGYNLPELTNAVTGSTPAFFEPALDYLAIKMPRWDLTKLKASDRTIGSEMKSVGEVMAIGRSFPEAIQKAVRMLGTGAMGLTDHPYDFADPESEVATATDRRIFAVADLLASGRTPDEIHELSKIDLWFLYQIEAIVKLDHTLASHDLTKDLIREAKLSGFADATLAARTGESPAQIRARRIKWNLRPHVKQIDTLAGEFDAETNYLYTTYHGDSDDVQPLIHMPIIVLGSGPYCIGSSVEFDWCAVNMVKTIKQAGRPTIIVNSNPETVSTDFDRSDRLYFEELTLERIQDIADFEAGAPIVVSVGGQTANNLALPLHDAGYRILGTTPPSIDRAEDRSKFSALLGDLGIDQPTWTKVTSLARAKDFARTVGYPVLIRPSYVLSGGAMTVVTNDADLATYLERATKLSPDHPVVISQFITQAKELEIDGVADHGRIVISAISEHIEQAGVHSGDATVVLPPQRLHLETVRRARRIARAIIDNLQVTGPFNIQFIAKGGDLKVIETNVRSSRSFPFVSKVTGHNFIRIATEVMLGIHDSAATYDTLDLDYVGVKSPQFSYNRLKGADPVAGVEMASTGEVASIAENLSEAFYTSWLAADQKLMGKRLFLSVPDAYKTKVADDTARLTEEGWTIYTTLGTHDFMASRGIATTPLYKLREHNTPTVQTAIADRQIDLMINVPATAEDDNDAYDIRRLAIDNHIPLVTNGEIGVTVLHALGRVDLATMPIRSWAEIVRAPRAA